MIDALEIKKASIIKEFNEIAEEAKEISQKYVASKARKMSVDDSLRFSTLRCRLTELAIELDDMAQSEHLKQEV